MGVMITGGTGYLGAEVVRILLKKGVEKPVIFSRKAQTKRLDDVEDQVKLVKGDLGTFSHVLNVVKDVRPQTIYHLGGMLSAPCDADPPAAMRANSLGTFHVLEAARLFDVSQVLFSSSIGTYGYDIREEVIDDYTLQRPQVFYGATKVFAEHMGLFYRRKYGLDFRGVRYPSIVGPGVRTPGMGNYTSWVIEECAKGRPFTIWVKPETRLPILSLKDAARAIVQLGEAPMTNIKMVNYLLAGITPIPSAGDLANIVRSTIPDAQIDFTPNVELQRILDQILRPFDDRIARTEWGWKPEYNLKQLVEDFLQELQLHPQRYE